MLGGGIDADEDASSLPTDMAPLEYSDRFICWLLMGERGAVARNNEASCLEVGSLTKHGVMATPLRKPILGESESFLDPKTSQPGPNFSKLED